MITLFITVHNTRNYNGHCGIGRSSSLVFYRRNTIVYDIAGLEHTFALAAKTRIRPGEISEHGSRNDSLFMKPTHFRIQSDNFAHN